LAALIIIIISAVPHQEERVHNPIDKEEFDTLLDCAKTLLNVHDDQYNASIRHTVVRDALKPLAESRGVTNLPLGVERRTDNPDYVTWTGPNTILGDVSNDPRFILATETRVTELKSTEAEPTKIAGAVIRNLNKNRDELVIARVHLLLYSFSIWC
jgi:pyranose oxidase